MKSLVTHIPDNVHRALKLACTLREESQKDCVLRAILRELALEDIDQVNALLMKDFEHHGFAEMDDNGVLHVSIGGA